MNVEEVSNPGYEQPKKSGRSLFACFGIGCVVLLVLCAVGGVASYFVFQDQINLIYEQTTLAQENMDLAKESDVVKEKLGEPITPVLDFANATPDIATDGDAQLITTKQKLSGPDGEGILAWTIRVEPGKDIEQVEVYFMFEDEKFDLSDTADFDLDINDGTEEETESEDETDSENSTEDEEAEEAVGAGSGG
ncbi:MAG: hypothetical protein AAGA30_01140 [Planctomycetota bacterium]